MRASIDTVQLHGQGQLLSYGVRLPPRLLYIYLFIYLFQQRKNANTQRTEILFMTLDSSQ